MVHHGIAAFVFLVIEYVRLIPDMITASPHVKFLLLSCEQFYLDWLLILPQNLRYNFLRSAYSSIGYKHSSEAKQVMSDSYSDERKARIGAFNRGQHLSPE